MKSPKSANPAAKQFGGYIRNRRLSLGLSRADLAHRLGLILGSHVSHVERGEARISPEALHNWAQALELEPQTLSTFLDMATKAEETQTLTFQPAQADMLPRIALA
jgi:transcriptional regulator with XRE-family HTH domain